MGSQTGAAVHIWNIQKQMHGIAHFGPQYDPPLKIIGILYKTPGGYGVIGGNFVSITPEFIQEHWGNPETTQAGMILTLPGVTLQVCGWCPISESFTCEVIGPAKGLKLW